MNYKKCVYFVEGPCEKTLIDALKSEPRLIMPGKVHVHNVIQEEIPRRLVIMIQAGSNVVFVFDTDVEKTDILKKNIGYVKRYASRITILNLVQVLNFEDEIVRATDVRRAQDLTKSSGVSEFKSAFCRMNHESCRNALTRHHFDIRQLWIKDPPSSFSFIEQCGDNIKLWDKERDFIQPG